MLQQQEHRDLYLRCQDCGCDFVWSSGEQLYYYANGLKPPKRCTICRKAKRDSYKDVDTNANRVDQQ